LRAKGRQCPTALGRTLPTYSHSLPPPLSLSLSIQAAPKKVAAKKVVAKKVSEIG